LADPDDIRPGRNDRLARLIERFAPGSRLRRAWPLHGGVSAQTTALEIERPDGGIESLVVRRHGKWDLARHPRVAADEFALLQILHAAGLAVPKPRHLERTGEIFGAPCVLLDHVEGQTELAPRDLDGYLARIAAQLAEIHAFGADRVPFLRRTVASAIAIEIEPSALTGAAAAARRHMPPPVQVNRPVLLHGDFWPGNILWRDGRLVAVIDWEDASIGDPLLDLGVSRLEILWAFGADAMRRFTELYRALTKVDLGNLAHWELYVAAGAAGDLANWGLDAAAEQSMREKLAWFAERACARLPLA
jgi:aminoglycoside phosphotransferase (APT) family kinase protein